MRDIRFHKFKFYFYVLMFLRPFGSKRLRDYFCPKSYSVFKILICQ